jgi:hypothetical protein
VREEDELAAFLVVEEVIHALLPVDLILLQHFNQVSIVLQLRVHHFDVFLILFQELSEFLEASNR